MIGALLRLMRFDKPIGIFLLLWPTYWALWLASDGMPSVRNLLVFTLGTVLMRAAGCVVNDIADRDFDGKVSRTALRPLATGELSLKVALITLLSLLSLSVSLLVFLRPGSIYFAVFGALVTVIYPFCKRFINMPQLVLGVAFSFGIPMAFYQVTGKLPLSAFYLMAMTFVWIVAYDTAYAMADREDDLQIGIHSTAIYWGQWDTTIISGLMALLSIGWLGLAHTLALGLGFYLGYLLGVAMLCYQLNLLSRREPNACFRAFLMNHHYGWLMWLAIIAGKSIKSIG